MVLDIVVKVGVVSDVVVLNSVGGKGWFGKGWSGKGGVVLDSVVRWVW